MRREADIVVASCHWGLGEEVLDYMTEIAHAAIDAGADIVIGHGPHYCIGFRLARLELEIALRVLTERLPKLRLVPGRPATWRPSLGQKGPDVVPVAW